MAIIVSAAQFPTIGSMMERAMNIMQQQAGSAGAMTFSLTTGYGCRGVVLNKVSGANTLQQELYCSDIKDTAVAVPLSYIINSEGWSTPALLTQFVGGSSTPAVTNWNDFIVNIRRQIFVVWCGLSPAAYVATNALTNQTAIRIYQYKLDIVWNTQWFVDVCLFSIEITVPVSVPYLEVVSPAPRPSYGPAMTGGSDNLLVAKLDEILTQLEAVTEVLNEIALTRIDVSLNHGQTIASVSTTTTSDGE